MNVVFVHLGGNSIPSYMYTAIRQVKKKTKCSLFVLMDRELTDTEDFELCGDEIVFVNIALLLKESQIWKDFLEANRLSAGFWTWTSARIVALVVFGLDQKLENIWHFENDVLLFRDLNEVDISKLGPVAIPFDNDFRAIASTVFVKHFNHLKILSDAIIRGCFVGLNDMNSLADIRHEITQLPIVPSEYVQKWTSISATFNIPNSVHPYLATDKNIGVWDAAYMGQCLFGTHQRPNVPFINETCYFDCSKLDFGVGEGDTLYCKAKHSDNWHILNTLHVHSKRLDDAIIYFEKMKL